MRDNIRAGHVEVDGLDIAAADARGETDRPHGYGVYVLQRESSATHPIAASTFAIQDPNEQVFAMDCQENSGRRQRQPPR